MASPIEISVLIPILATKAEHLAWLREAVDSVLGQDYPVREVVICDDASPVDIRDFPDCTVYRFDEHGGVCKARNMLGEVAVSEYIMFLDGDDKLYKGALRKMAERAKPDRVVYGNLMVFGQGFTERYLSLKECDGNTLLEDPIMPITSLHTKKAFDTVGGFDPQFEGGLEEWDYNIRLMLAGICGDQIHEPVFWYRRHKDQRSNGRDWLREQTHKIRDRYRMLEGMEMGCCGGRNRPRSVGNPGNPGGSLSASQLASGEMVLIEYTGDRQGSIVLRGQKTNTNYRFGATQRQKFVWPQDAQAILQLPGYRLVARERTVPVQGPDAVLLEQEIKDEPGRGRPTPADDLTAIKGLGKVAAAKLAEVGFTNYRDIVVADPENVAQIAGVSVKRATGWQERAKELA